VTAESIYEAAALGVPALKNSGWADAIARGRELEIQVRELATCHPHAAADSALLRWRRGQPRRDAEKATIEATARLRDCAALK